MLDIERVRQALRISIVEGALAHIFANLTGAIFLPAFALLLGADSFQIGLLASIQFFTTVAQLPGSIMVEQRAQRKKFAVHFAFVARILWLPLVLVGFIGYGKIPDHILLMLLIFIAVGYNIFASVSGVAWLSWMADLVPDEIRGRFFGLRNSVLGMMTIIVTITGGYFLDWFPQYWKKVPVAYAFFILFLIAVIAGMVSTFLLRRQPEPAGRARFTGHFLELVTEPLANPNFRRLLTFAVFWSFSVNFAAPFYVVYMIRDLTMSYTLLSLLTILSAMADLTGMGIWGHFSDQVGNRPIMIITAGIAAVIPSFWLITDPGTLSLFFFIPFFHLLGGFVVSGYNLTSVNMIFRSAPQQGNSVYFALWAICNGVTAGLGALTGGFVAGKIPAGIPALGIEFDSVFKMIFLLSASMRVFSLLFLFKVQEDKGQPIRHVIRILRNVRGWASMMGYHPVLQFFLPAKNGDTTQSGIWPIWKRGGH
jgi:MFS family permease